ncbi:unknown [Prevotella sp. CAG:485]|nr:unknown [Prevotella sp. CAG:485]
MNTSSDKPQPAAISEKQPEIQPSFQPESNPAAKPDNLPENRSENKSENGFENRPERRRRRVALILVALFLVLSLCALLLFLFLRPADPRKPFPLTIDYPLERPYPLPAIVTPEQMADYYPLILDDSLLRVLATASWHPDG